MDAGTGWVGTLWDCCMAVERALEARGGLNFDLLIKKRINLVLLFAKQESDFLSLNYQQLLSLQTTNL